MACKRFVGSIPIASTQLTRAFTPSAGSAGGPKSSGVRDSCREVFVRALVPRAASMRSAETVTDRSDAVPVVAVEGLWIVTKQVGDFLDRRPNIEKE